MRKELPNDYAGTLKQVGALGYRQVEAAGYFNHTAEEVNKAMRDAGLNLVSAHYPHDQFQAHIDEIIDFNKKLGVQYLICASPGIKNPARLKNMKPKDWADAFTMEDWRWNAEQFNQFGEKVHAAGLKFGYHNHTMEFKKQKNGEVPYIELLKLTDPSLVTMEMDCGWVVVGGGNPIELLEHYPTRISMLHIKDFKFNGKPMSVSNPPQSAELGRGSIDYADLSGRGEDWTYQTCLCRAGAVRRYAAHAGVEGRCRIHAQVPRVASHVAILKRGTGSNLNLVRDNPVPGRG